MDDAEQRAGAALLAIFTTDDGLANPYPYLHELRQVAPVFVTPSATILSRFDDARTVLGDPRFGNGERQPSTLMSDPDAQAARRRIAERRRDETPSMLFLDPPGHTRQRSLVSRAFTPRRIEELRPVIATMVEGYLDRLAAEDSAADLMELVARPFPVNVISHMLGVPDEDWGEMRAHVNRAAVSLEPTATADELDLADESSQWMRDYFIELVAERRRRPTVDLVSALVEARDADDRLTEGEILAVAQLLFGAGSETTTNLIGNGMNALLDHPEQRNALWAEPALVGSAVEEMLRFDSPVQVDGRVCLEPAELFDLRFEPGDRVTTLLGAANRDPARFDDPDRFDISRGATTLLSFGHGIHYCLGANLARVEAQEFFAAFIARFASVEAAGDRPYRRRVVLRGLDTCPVTVTTR